MSRLFSFTFALVLTATLPSLAGAQPAQTGTITGVVEDASGGVLPGVAVTVTSQERGVARVTTTDQAGRYVFAAVPRGSYSVEATLAGFSPAVSAGNLVETEKTTAVPITMRVGALTDSVTVVGQTPLVDRTNAAANTRVRREEFEALPVGRTYQALIGVTPGVVGTGNVNALGALTSSNLFVVDSIDTTDPAQGTAGTTLNFEAIQEVSVSTSAVSVEYGRGQGAVVNVITKSGTNRYEGSAKYIAVNDRWDAANSTTSEVTGASLARVKFDQVNPSYATTLGGPLLTGRAWFFAAHEYSTNTTPQRQTTGPIPEDYQQVTDSNLLNVRGTVQLTGGQQAWLKYHRSPTNGFVFDYWPAGSQAAEREALTLQDQSSDSWAGQWTAVLRDHWTVEAAAGNHSSRIDVRTFEQGRLGGSPVFSQADNRNYNGATYNGFVDRPRRQASLATTLFVAAGGRTHSLKGGVEVQSVASGSLFSYPNNQYFLAQSYDQATGVLVPDRRRDYQSGDSTSTGRHYAAYLRDKFDVSDRLFVEAGVRLEKQTGASDLGVTTVDTLALAPRAAATFDVTGDGATLLVGSYGRYHAGIIQGFSDGFAGVPQQTNYDNYVWDGTAYVLQNQVRAGGSSFQPNADLRPSYLDEFTVGLQRQVGRSFAAGVRLIARDWRDLIDDVRTFNADGSINRQVVNYDPATRNYRGAQATLEKRFSNNWNAAASYTYSRTEGNHFDQTFTALGDYIDAQCRTTLDTTIGANGVISCLEVQNGDNKYGRPIYDRPHNFKLNGAYVRPVGPINLSVGALAEAISKRRYEKVRSMNVLLPGTLLNQGATATYFYNARGSDPVDGLEWYVDGSLEVTWRGPARTQVGFKGEAFNVTNREEKIISNNTAFCGSTATAACATAVANYGKATARGSFQTPRRYRVSAIFRF